VSSVFTEQEEFSVCKAISILLSMMLKLYNFDAFISFNFMLWTEEVHEESECKKKAKSK